MVARPFLTRRALGLVGVVASLAGGLAACGGSGPPTWVLANVHVDGYPTARALHDLAGLAAPDGSRPGVRIDLQLAGVLGNEKETLEKLGFGGVQMACVSAAPLAEFVEEMGVLALPYLFDDAEHLRRVLEGEVGESFDEALGRAGFVALAWYDAGARSFYNRVRPVRRLEDLAGLKIRVQRSEVMSDMVRALGATPVAIGFKEVYSSLQTGAIDGAENNLPSYSSERHFEAAPHYTLDEHSRIPDVVLVRRPDWEALADDERSRLREAATASAERQRVYWQEFRAAAEERLLAAGVEIHRVEDPEAFREAVEGVYEAHAARYGDLVGRIRAASTR